MFISSTFIKGSALKMLSAVNIQHVIERIPKERDSTQLQRIVSWINITYFCNSHGHPEAEAKQI